jgi:hypothetical protein
MKQKDIVEKIRDLGYKVTVFTAHVCNRGGIPDTLISYAGKAIWLEIKINDDELSALQKDFAEEFYMSWCCLHYNSKNKEYKVTPYDYYEIPDMFARGLEDKLNEGVKG